jgi:hypothetical protein
VRVAVLENLGKKPCQVQGPFGPTYYGGPDSAVPLSAAECEQRQREASAALEQKAAEYQAQQEKRATATAQAIRDEAARGTSIWLLRTCISTAHKLAGYNIPTPALIISKDVSIDCSGGVVIAGTSDGIVIDTAGVEVTLRGLVIIGLAIDNTQVQAGIDAAAAALVRVENCKISGFSQADIKAEPSASNVTVKIQDSTILTNGSGVLVAPTGSGSVSMSIDRSRIENNSGDGVRTDTSSGAISASISDSSISFNNGNGLNAVSISGAQNMLTLVRDVITKSGSAGVQANGANAAALVNNTVLDSNTAGATSAVGGGRILTYSNNQIVGTPGSAFTGPASLQ